MKTEKIEFLFRGKAITGEWEQEQEEYNEQEQEP